MPEQGVGRVRHSRAQRGDVGSAVGWRSGLRAAHQPVRQALLDLVGEQPDEVVVRSARNAGSRRGEARTGSRGVDVHVDVRARDRVDHAARRAARLVEGVDLQHRLDEVHERRTPELVDRRRLAVPVEVRPARVEPEHVVAEVDRLGALHVRAADDDLEVDADALLRRTSLRRHDLERDIRMPLPEAAIAGAAMNPLNPSVADNRTTPASAGASSGESRRIARSTSSAAASACSPSG